ncbi:rhodanese-like domain-containing protein [Deinococcus sp.]|uniref:rhodanese-like domain-containing protein n=1 Tax=Deinococcus sp. TaxID=47478 RepID=UPI002869B465|nr:rhodanese-like domain-containing protein [Deinococcus sp.]
MLAFFKKFLASAAGPASLSPQDAQALVKSGAVLLDVRSAAERKALFIPGSMHIPLNELPGRLGTLPKGKTIVCQCASGARSAQALRILTDASIDARNLGGGIAAWRGAGLPTK